MEDTIYIVVVRHGERIDYSMRDNEKKNWLIGQERPWDPPLTSFGMKHATKLGEHLNNSELPPISMIYTSPFVRCRQTSYYIRKGVIAAASLSSSSTSLLQDNMIPIHTDWGLAESLNEKWYRSWSLPGSDGTWGYGNSIETKEYDNEMINDAAKLPVQQSIIPIMEKEINKRLYDENYHPTSIPSSSYSDTTITKIKEPYCMYTKTYENGSNQRQRMMETLEHIVEETTNNNDINKSSNRQHCFLLVSHGGPVTHLFTALTNKNWKVHGESTYCCYSIYRTTLKRSNTTTGSNNDNSNNHDDEKIQDSTTNKSSNSILEWETICFNQSIDISNIDDDDKNHTTKLQSIDYMD